MVDGQIISVQGDYEVLVGKSLMDEETDNPVYIVYNTKWGVVEAETSCLPQALMTAQSYNRNVEDFFEAEATDDFVLPGEDGSQTH